MRIQAQTTDSDLSALARPPSACPTWCAFARSTNRAVLGQLVFLCHRKRALGAGGSAARRIRLDERRDLLLVWHACMLVLCMDSLRRLLQ